MKLNKMKHLALFNGIGGFQLAAHLVGWENVAHVEIDEWCNRVVKQHFPESECHTDIKNFNGTKYKGTIDIITGGFPCQPFSGSNDGRTLPDTNGTGCEELDPTSITEGHRFYTGNAFEGRNYWQVEPGVGKVANGVSNRVDRIKGLGNAIVPQVALEIFRAINKTLDVR